MEKDKFLEESKRLKFLLSSREIDHDQVLKDLQKSGATLQIVQEARKNNCDKLKDLTVQLKIILQGGDSRTNVSLLQQTVADH